jgi:two-component system response regulator HydG
MPRSTTPPALLALVRPEDRGLLERVALSTRMEVAAVDTPAELFTRLRASTWAATLVSLSVDQVDEDVVRLLSGQAGTGDLFVSAPGLSLSRTLALRGSGAAAFLREPLVEGELRPRLLAVANEGRPVPLPVVDDAGSKEGDDAPMLVGESSAMASVFDTVARVASSSATVLLTGESGTGKEVVARTLHWASARASGPFVPVNCAAIPEHLLETELFGHERGAFTGAVARRVGRFERAHGGTIFLDEIGDMSLVLQAKVLRVLEDRTVERVGGDEGRTVDVRVIAATNQDLTVATSQGRFREDLFHRLAVVELHLPPLRDRGNDVRTLALHFAAHFARRHSKPIRAISERALSQLENATWRGNVRELRNVMDRAVILANGTTIRSEDLKLGASAPIASAHAAPGTAEGYLHTRSLQEVEADHIRRVLAAARGHMGQAAETLGIHRNTLTRKMKELGVESVVDGRVSP